MARAQEFDREAVIAAARTQFWETGYEATSVPALERATGLSRSSIYNSFGSKKGLFDAAVASYVCDIIRTRLAPLQRKIVTDNALANYLDGLAEAFSGQDSIAAANGCLLLNAASAPIARDTVMAQVLVDYRSELHEAMSRGVQAYGFRGKQALLLTDAVTGLVVAGFITVRIDANGAVSMIEAAQHLLAERPREAVELGPRDELPRLDYSDQDFSN
ncbi:TetR/AcrR family transcriptional regulator [Corynebacterium alimapuense]|uniref:TetR/AcrR family transcriptional regulator n=1 Tax=Corynebacterium alimapuense TaxID=1576874 RepID=A0A3M8K4E0_9CORY|nr:TetR/AcrR family transcriptional regulator [Corynebacterium alimapuense]RNE48087.1 TetR/AcrR family transcriptional regulator [Corynebacterium alimapuense]